MLHLILTLCHKLEKAFAKVVDGGKDGEARAGQGQRGETPCDINFETRQTKNARAAEGPGRATGTVLVAPSEQDLSTQVAWIKAQRVDCRDRVHLGLALTGLRGAMACLPVHQGTYSLTSPSHQTQLFALLAAACGSALTLHSSIPLWPYPPLLNPNLPSPSTPQSPQFAHHNTAHLHTQLAGTALEPHW
ncbi:hypothetical protein HaLaN_30692 [Haematococcus lacustris]|uniref:Uncharacterized protein n=1 Tax=Haematococcus lacustris TaxID=44745 RepID=A0A6A0AG27_HAELA|nr:hypothetical protein HaLaN_30692 [Haematococcus lacustris]